MIARTHLVVLMSLLLLPPAARAEEKVATLTLDGLSFLSFEHMDNLPIPAGSTIQLRFPDASAQGSIPFTIEPSDVSIRGIPLPSGGGELSYGLAKPTSGAMTKVRDGFELSFPATISVKLLPEGSHRSGTHLVSFTTKAASSTSLKTGQTLSVEGFPVVPAARYVQLVGAVTNPADAFPHPGRAVVTVLSGTFDWLPTLE